MSASHLQQSGAWGVRYSDTPDRNSVVVAGIWDRGRADSEVADSHYRKVAVEIAEGRHHGSSCRQHLHAAPWSFDLSEITTLPKMTALYQ